MRDRAEDLAFFVVACHLSPTEYYNLTFYEREAIIQAYQKSQGK